MTTLNYRTLGGVWTPIAGDVSAVTPINDIVIRPNAKVRANTSQNMPTGSLTTVVWNLLIYGTSGMYTAASSRLTLPRTGSYIIGYTACYDASASTGERGVFMAINGSGSDRLGQENIAVMGGGYPRLSGSTLVNVVAGAYVELKMVQSTGGNLNINPETEMFAAFVSD